MPNRLTLEPWSINDVQFPRLIAEAEAAGLFNGDDGRFTAMCESMDLSVDEVFELVERAKRRWDEVKAATGNTAERHKLDRLLDEARELHETNEIELDGPLFPCHTSEGDDGTWVRAWVLVPP